MMRGLNPETVQLAGRLLGGLVGDVSQSPVLKMARRYWYLSIPVALTLYGKLRERWDDKGKVKLHHIFVDAADTLGPILTIVAVFELAGRLEREGKLDAPPPAASRIRDAQFTVEPGGGPR
jgi:hypothetical protein